MRVEQAVPSPGFARHETFHLRFGWLKKCHDAVKKDARVFQREDALVRLGVGKNMVRSIRFWGIATKVIRQTVEPGESGRRGGQEVEVTDMGRRIFDERHGWDPYLERPETLWLLHWRLYAPPSSIPAWWILLNDLNAVRIRADELSRHVLGKVSMVSTWAIPNESSIKKDTDVFVHTYASRRGHVGDIEDYMDCPFRALRILRADASAKSGLQFAIGKKPGMSAGIVAHICLDFMARRGTGARTVSIGSLAGEPGGPGHVLKVGEAELAELLAEAAEEHGGIIGVRDVNGMAHLSFPKNVGDAAVEILDRMYAQDGHRAKRPRALATARGKR